MSGRDREAGEAVSGTIVGIVVEGVSAFALAVSGSLTGSFPTVCGFAVAHPAKCAM